MNIPGGTPQLFGAACFAFGMFLLTSHRRELGRFRILFLPFSVSLVAFFIYFLRNVIDLPDPFGILGNIFTFLMWASWLFCTLLILRMIEKRRAFK
jgi:hypothetical protein